MSRLSPFANARRERRVPSLWQDNAGNRVSPAAAALPAQGIAVRPGPDLPAAPAAQFRSWTRETPRVSVVVPACRRPSQLLQCLHALIKQDFPNADYEIIVVDDGGNPATRRVVQAVAGRSRGAPAVQYLAANDAKGPAAARNRGWMYARSAVIAFTDAAAVPARDWLSYGMTAMTPNIVAVSGQILAPRPALRSLNECDTSSDTRAEFVRLNYFVHRRALVAVGGFDERFTAAWCEDSDLHFRLIERFGGEQRIRHEAQARVMHRTPPAGLGISFFQQRRLQFDALLHKKHPLLYRSCIRRAPRWDYYAIFAALGVTLAAAAAGQVYLTGAALVLWSLLTLRCVAQRLNGKRHTLMQFGQMIATSVAVPPLAVFWRCVGVLRYRVLPD